ncbi:hypothetical protein DFH06DRAFT_1149719 [Mycena polygramma]|nr:hypothetical protein DFH06DRAFT_1149719 [Mycena polygramma]
MSTLPAPHATRFSKRLRQRAPSPTPSRAQSHPPQPMFSLDPRMRKKSFTRPIDGPILALPNELIAEIFTHVCDPTLVAQICGHLRNIALSCPSLWSTFSLAPNRYNLSSQLAMTKEWLKRSGSCSLSVTIDHEAATNMEDSQALAPPSALYYRLVLPMLKHRDTLSRLERLDLRVDLSSSSLRLLQTLMPNLTHLGLFANRGEELLISPHTFPHLRSIELRRVLETPSVQFPYAQITALRFDDVELHQLREILAKTIALLHCEVSALRPGGLDDGKMLRLERLESLVFSEYRRWGYTRWEDVVFPIAAMSLPSLRILQVPEIYLNYPPHEGALALIERSGCKLEELRIVGLMHTTEAAFREKLACTRTGAVFYPQEPRQVSALTDHNFDFAPLPASAVACNLNQGLEDDCEEGDDLPDEAGVNCPPLPPDCSNDVGEQWPPDPPLDPWNGVDGVAPSTTKWCRSRSPTFDDLTRDNACPMN